MTGRAIIGLCALAALALGSLGWAGRAAAQAVDSAAAGPRIVNIYNFIRNEDYRLEDSQQRLFEATCNQVELFRKHNLPVTWALQYDALINPKYQELLKNKIGPNDEIGAWWELPRPLVEAAGIAWRGDHDWVSTANIAFSPGYTPTERKKLVDAYMAEFHRVFGTYPRSVGSWYIDEVTLAYMAERYDIVASCNCKDQIGTDGYTLWGGYWNQAYYPSRVNAYMPAQTTAGQIPVPVFRMLGSDPIYQYGRVRSISSLEPVYRRSGGSSEWVDWFLGSLVRNPCLAFAYTQAGQENSFGWDAMRSGLEMQAEQLAELSQAGKIRVETLAQSGEWFRQEHPLTPPTAFACLDDWRNEGRKSVWYNSRFYRFNLFWDERGLSVRDIHRFDESRVSPTHDTALAESSLAYGTLAIVDGVEPMSRRIAGGFPMIQLNGEQVRIEPQGEPVVSQPGESALTVVQPLRDGGEFAIRCEEERATLSLTGASGEPHAWSLAILGQRRLPVIVSDNLAEYQSPVGAYQLKLGSGGERFEEGSDGTLQIRANGQGNITLLLGIDDQSVPGL